MKQRKSYVTLTISARGIQKKVKHAYTLDHSNSGFNGLFRLDSSVLPHTSLMISSSIQNKAQARASPPKVLLTAVGSQTIPSLTHTACGWLDVSKHARMAFFNSSRITLSRDPITDLPANTSLLELPQQGALWPDQPPNCITFTFGSPRKT